MFKVYNDIPDDMRPAVLRALDQAEKASGQPMLRYTYEELLDASEWLAAYQSTLTGEQLYGLVLNRFNQLEQSAIWGLVQAKDDVEVQRIKNKVRSSLQRSRRLIQKAVELVKSSEPVKKHWWAS